MQSSASNASVEGTLLRGKRDRDLESWQTVFERRNLHVYWKQKADSVVHGESASQRRLSEAEADVYPRNREQKNADVALCETNRELESQRLELYQANQSTDQAQREKINLCGELEMRSRVFSGRLRKRLLRS